MNLSMKYSIGLYGVLCLLAGLSGCEEMVLFPSLAVKIRFLFLTRTSF